MTETESAAERGPSARFRWPLLILIAVCAVARLYKIDAPPFDHHPFRQFDTAALARNMFEEGGLNLFFPQVDWRGSSAGYVEVEFQAYTWCVAALYSLFGVAEWMGRAFSIVFYALSALVLFRLVKRLFDEPVALGAVFVYSLAPLSFFFTRSFQPDAMLCFASLLGVHHFWLWTEERRAADFACSVLGIALALAIKPLSVYLAVPLCYLCIRGFGWRLLRMPSLWFFAFAVATPALLWYRHAEALWDLHGNSFFRGYAEFHVPGLDETPWTNLIKRVPMWHLLKTATPAGAAFLLVGLFTRPTRGNYLLHWWAGGFALSFVLSVEAFAGHDYYQLPSMFAVAGLTSAGALALVRRGALPRWGLAIACVAFVGLAGWQIRPMLFKTDWGHRRQAFGELVQEMTEPDAKIVFVETRPSDRLDWFEHRTPHGEYLYHSPIDLYLSHRKGWSIGSDQLSPEFLEVLAQRGARYCATFGRAALNENPALEAALDERHETVAKTDSYALYRLRRSAD